MENNFTKKSLKDNFFFLDSKDCFHYGSSRLLAVYGILSPFPFFLPTFHLVKIANTNERYLWEEAMLVLLPWSDRMADHSLSAQRHPGQCHRSVLSQLHLRLGVRNSRHQTGIALSSARSCLVLQ